MSHPQRCTLQTTCTSIIRRIYFVETITGSSFAAIIEYAKNWLHETLTNRTVKQTPSHIKNSLADGIVYVRYINKKYSICPYKRQRQRHFT